MAIKLSGLGAQNPWWRGGHWEEEDVDLKDIDVLLNRKKIEIKKGEVYLFRGIRRAGKTVYIKSIIKELIGKIDGRKILYLSCDRYHRGETKNTIKEFIKRSHGEVVILDEITYLDDWHLILKELAETTDLTILATGSNPLKIKEKGERLPGRKIEGNEYFIGPLSFRDFLSNLINLNGKIKNPDIFNAVRKIKKFKSFQPTSPDINEEVPYFDEIDSLFYSYLLTGGFPSVINEYLKNGRIDERSYEMIVRMFLGALSKEGKNEEIGRELMERMLSLGTSRTDFHTIGSDIGVHHNTVKEYVELLENSRMIYLLPAWDLSRKRYAPRKQKKFIFQSSFLSSSLYVYLTGGKYEDALDFLDKNLESIIEQTASSHLIWAYEKPLIRERHSFAGFYYDKKECDFLLHENMKWHGFEVKYGKVEREKYPFPVFYLTKDTFSEDSYPVSLFLAGLEKSEKSI
ncbi:MAG: hypothetical protein CVT48_06640 [Thermoplasmata archaeon HGW-Thermoplasmata-1]|nr:MAG: hypothetical protein CVT48_06640 [Thermoplasmata archaeon HGW-Thermoplasmata-1]